MPKVHHVMTKEVVSVPQETPLLDCVAKMSATSISALAVCEGEKPIGIFSERDLLTRVVAKGIDPKSVVVKDVMTQNVMTVGAEDDLDMVFRNMREFHIRHVPVIDTGRLVGMVSIRDLLHRPDKLDTKVSTWMTETPICASPHEKLLEVCQVMSEKQIGAVVAMEGGAVVGIFTERDLLTKVAGTGRDPKTLVLGDVMTTHPTAVSVDTEFETIYDIMVERRLRHLPVMDGKKLAGIVSQRDVMRLRQKVLERLVDNKNDLVQRYMDLLERPGDERVQKLILELEKVKKDAVVDDLTGLYNFRYFQMRFAEEVERAQRYDRVMSVIIGDIDDFKKQNDSYGHQAGNEILQDVASLMARSFNVFKIVASFRRVDLVARYGGEEFVVIMPETTAENARIACERVRKAIAEFPFLTKKLGKPVQVTMSFGIATFPSNASNHDDLLKRADQALYMAKRSGKNCVKLADGPQGST